MHELFLQKREPDENVRFALKLTYTALAEATNWLRLRFGQLCGFSRPEREF